MPFDVLQWSLHELGLDRWLPKLSAADAMASLAGGQHSPESCVQTHCVVDRCHTIAISLSKLLKSTVNFGWRIPKRRKPGISPI